MAAFPRSSVEEAGLCLLDPAELPPHWGFGPGSLPHIGASPDAMLKHPAGSSGMPIPQPPAASPTPAAPHGAPPAPATAGVDPSARPPPAPAVATVGDAGPQSGGGPAPGLLSADIEALLQQLTQGRGGGGATAHSTALSTQALVPDQKSSAPSAAPAQAAPVGVPTVAPRLSAHVDPFPPVVSGGGGGGGVGGGYQGVVLEAVELKNTCPFQMRSRVNARGKRSSSFVLDDRGPRDQVPSYWVPQLQMEMLAAGTPSVLLVSRSATEGINLFRMHRDEDYLRLMLHYVSKLWVQYAMPPDSPPPPQNIWWNEPDYQSLLSQTVALARTTPLLSHIAQPVAHPDANDGRLFLDRIVSVNSDRETAVR